MKLLIIFPCFNEEEVLENSIDRFFGYFQKLLNQNLISDESRICFVDDGSTDNTWHIISQFKSKYACGIKLSSNFGHQNALLAGLETFKNKFDTYITLDVDLQDDYTVIDQMIQKCNQGSDIVYGVRKDRSTDTFFKRKSAIVFYKLLSFLNVKTIYNHADFRLITNQALLNFLEFTETHLFLRAIFPKIGLKSDIVYYDRLKREDGKSKYPLKKMMTFAWDGITSFSVKPLRYILIVGIVSTVLAFLFLVWATIQLLLGNTLPGWFSIVALIMFFGGIQTFALGIIGEYVGKIFLQVKNRPRYIVEEISSDSK